MFVVGCVPICFHRLGFLSLPPGAALKCSFTFTYHRVIYSVLSIIRVNCGRGGLHGWLRDTDDPKRILYWDTNKKKLITIPPFGARCHTCRGGTKIAPPVRPPVFPAPSTYIFVHRKQVGMKGFYFYESWCWRILMKIVDTFLFWIFWPKITDLHAFICIFLT